MIALSSFNNAVFFFPFSQEKTDEVLKSYVVYIFDQWMADNSVCSIDEVKKCCQVLTNKGPVNPLSTPVHFTTKYGNKLDLKAQLPSKTLKFLDCLCLILIERYSQYDGSL